jgi:hypothetical protein
MSIDSGGDIRISIALGIQPMHDEAHEDEKIITMIGGAVEGNDRYSFDTLKREYTEETGLIHNGAMAYLCEWVDCPSGPIRYNNEFYVMTNGSTALSIPYASHMMIELPIRAFGELVSGTSDMALLPWVKKAWRENDILSELLEFLSKWDGQKVEEMIRATECDFVWDSKYFAHAGIRGQYIIERSPVFNDEGLEEKVGKVVYRKARVPKDRVSITIDDLLAVLKTFYVTPQAKWHEQRVSYDLVDVVDEIRNGDVLQAVVLHPYLAMLR